MLVLISMDPKAACNSSMQLGRGGAQIDGHDEYYAELMINS